MKIVVFALGIALVVSTALSLVRSAQWWIRVFDFARLEIAIAIAVAIVAFLFLYDSHRIFDNLFLATLVISVGYQLYWIYPYTPLATKQVVQATSCDTSNSIRLLIANVMMDNRQAEDFLALVRQHDPDVVLTVETDDWWDQKMKNLDRDYPYAVKNPRENTYGMHLFSKLKLDSPEIRFLMEDEVPSIRTGIRLRSGDWFDFYGLHPRPPKPRQDTEERDAEILFVGKEVKANGRPAIIAGDLNDVAWSHTTRLFQRISGMLDPRIGRGMFNTFHAKYPVLRWPLDHVFLEESFTIRELRRLGFFGSDHFPVLAELCYEPKAARRQDTPTANEDDRKEARQKIEMGKEAGE